MTTPHRALFSQYPLVQIASAFAAGILSANFLAPQIAVTSIVCAILSVGASVALVARRQHLSGVLLLLAMMGAGASLALLDKPSADSHTLKNFLSENNAGESQQMALTGVIDGPVDFARDRLYLTIKVERVDFNQCERIAKGVVSLLALFQNPQSDQEYRALRLRYGDHVQVKTTLRRTDQYRNPGVGTLTEYLDRKGLDATGQLKSPRMITRLVSGRTFNPAAWLYDWRGRLQEVIDTNFNSETSGVLDAAILGNRYNLSRLVSERFRAGGTFHVLVISGLHISFVGGVILLFVRRLTRNRLMQFGFSTLVVWCYSMAVGAEASVVRAALMFTFVTLAVVLFRRASSLNALGAAALILLIQKPRDLYDPSLQLTFLSVLAIVVFAWPLIQKLTAIGAWRPTRASPYPPSCSRWLKTISEILFWSERSWKKESERSPHRYRLRKTGTAAWLERYRLQRCARFIFCAVLVSVSVQLMLLPLLIVYFHRISLSSFILNIGVSALLAALVIVVGASLLVLQISATCAAPLFALSNGINWLLVHSVDPFSALGLDSVRLPEYSGSLSTIYVFYYVPLLFLTRALLRWQPLGQPLTSTKGRIVIAAVGQVLFGVLVVLHPWSVRSTQGRLTVDFLDVGQGDSALVTMPDGTTLLIDGGGRPNFFRNSNGDRAAPERDLRSIGETVVSEYLWWLGLDHVDYVLATHADADHIDGLNDVVRNFSVRSALVARSPAGDPEYARFAESLRSTGTHLELIGAGDVLHFGAVEAKVLSPEVTTDENAPSGNDDSVVLRLQFGKRIILLTGDIEKNAEAVLLNSGQEVAADIVKVPHHGSRTSSTEAFVRATQAHLAIISVGQTSIFGHPHKEVVERWQKSGATVLTTGRCGRISVTTDGSELAVQQYVQ